MVCDNSFIDFDAGTPAFSEVDRDESVIYLETLTDEALGSHAGPFILPKFRNLHLDILQLSYQRVFLRIPLVEEVGRMDA